MGQVAEGQVWVCVHVRVCVWGLIASEAPERLCADGSGEGAANGADAKGRAGPRKLQGSWQEGLELLQV